METTWKEKGKGQTKSSQDGAWDKNIRGKFLYPLLALRREPDAWDKNSEDKGSPDALSLSPGTRNK